MRGKETENTMITKEQVRESFEISKKYDYPISMPTKVGDNLDLKIKIDKLV